MKVDEDRLSERYDEVLTTYFVSYTSTNTVVSTKYKNLDS